MAAARPLLQNMLTEHRVENRRAERHEVSFRSELRQNDRPSVNIHVVDISTLGFRARCDNCPPHGPIQVALPGIGFMTARLVWALGGRIGGEFVRPIDTALYYRMLHSAPEQTPWHD